jgi:hypothetical protein
LLTGFGVDGLSRRRVRDMMACMVISGGLLDIRRIKNSVVLKEESVRGKRQQKHRRH